MQFGVDEAGKGPVIGPMVAACVAGDPDALPADVDDSKRVAPARREELASHIREGFQVGIAHITPERIDGPEDMNTLTVAAHAEAMGDCLTAGATGVCDAGDVNADRFGARVTDRLPFAVTLHATHRADEEYPLVAAASIVAKVERDAVIERLAVDYGDVGSGYPSDPRTRTFLREWVRDHGTLPGCARASWKTAKDVLAAAEQSDLDSF